MRTIILSPHVDDAIFSMADGIQELRNQVIILSVFSGYPTDAAGRKKHTILREEHYKACEVMGVQYINGNFLDDVYDPRPTKKAIRNFLFDHIQTDDKVISPLGIHHPDHILLRETAVEYLGVKKFYVELPYAKLYRPMVQELIQSLGIHSSMTHYHTTAKKKEAVECYKSQIQNAHILNDLLVPEQFCFL